MIPVFVKDAWLRAQALEQDVPDQSVSPDDHGAARDMTDPVLRGCIFVITVIVVLAALSLTKAISAPVFAGIILGLVFGSAVDRMARAGLPTGLAAGLVVLGCFLGLMVLIGLFSAPFAIWSDRLPEIIAALKQRATEVLTWLRPVMAVGVSLTTPDVPARNMVAVEQGAPWYTIAATSTSFASGLLIAFGTMYFYLATRRQMKARALRLCLGVNARRQAGQFLGDIEDRIAGYLGVVTVINLGMGVITTLIAWLFGLPFPLFWGLLAFVLNYVMFVGPLIMKLLLLGAGLIDDEPLLTALIPAFVYFIVNLIEANVVTPLAIGRRLTVNPFLVFLSFVFWLWLWGPLGAILATPILLIATIAVDSLRMWRETEAAADEPAAGLAQGATGVREGTFAATAR